MLRTDHMMSSAMMAVMKTGISSFGLISISGPESS
jgi:hypothetical protein